MPGLFEKRFIINTGKGGVGKTTISAAIGLAAARQGKKVLIMELGTKEKMSRLFGSDPVGSQPVLVEENLYAVNVTPDAALEEYVVMKLKLRTLYKAVFDNRFVRSFLRVIPGLNELVLLGKAWYEERATEAWSGKPRWDMIVIDAPATGHGVFFLKIPSVIVGAIGSGPMYDEAQQIRSLIEDPERTALNLITLVEEMPVNETIELKQEIEDTLGVPLGYVVANEIYAPRFGDDDAELMDRLKPHLADDSGGQALAGLFDAAVFRAERVHMQASYLDRIRREVELPLIKIPYYFTERFGFMTISKIADDLTAQVLALEATEPMVASP